MTRAAVLLANSKYIATQERTEAIGGKSLQVHYQGFIEEDGADSSTWIRKALATAAAAKDFSVDGSATAVNHDYAVPAGQTLYLRKVSFLIRDTDMTNWDQIGGAGRLTTGLTLKVLLADETERIDLLDGLTIKGLADFALLCGNSMRSEAGTQDGFAAEVVFTRALKVVATDIVRLLVSDNLSSLESAHCLIEGDLRS